MTGLMLFTAEFKGRHPALYQVQDEGMVALRHAGLLPGALEFPVQLCLEEALINAYLHGNQQDESAVIRLEIQRDGDMVVIRVYDEGRGPYPECVTMPSPETMGGRGLCLIRHYMNSAKYHAGQHCFEMRYNPEDRPGTGGENHGIA